MHRTWMYIFHWGYIFHTGVYFRQVFIFFTDWNNFSANRIWQCEQVLWQEKGGGWPHSPGDKLLNLWPWIMNMKNANIQTFFGCSLFFLFHFSLTKLIFSWQHLIWESLQYQTRKNKLCIFRGLYLMCAHPYIIENTPLFQWTVYVKPFRNEDMSAYVKKVVKINVLFSHWV